MRQIKALKITTLDESIAYGKCLGQDGLSFLMELVDAKGKKRKIIFDTGGSKKALLHNIKALKVDVSDVDSVILSHGHFDHTAATVEIVRKIAGSVKIYAHPHTFLPRIYEGKNGKRRLIGVPKKERLNDIEKAGGDVFLKKEPAEVAPGVWTTGQISRVTTFECALPLSEGERAIIVIDGEETDDEILDDQALWMTVERIGPVVISGCAHAGPANTLLQIQKIGNFQHIYGLVGGTHLVDRSDEYFQKTLNEFRKYGLRLISPCHCTGFKAASNLWRAFPGAFALNFSGRIIEVGKVPEMQVF